MMKMTADKLAKYFVRSRKLIFHSVDLSLYMVSAIVEGQEYYIADSIRVAFLEIEQACSRLTKGP